MYVSDTQICLSRGMSTPAMRATSAPAPARLSALLLLVLRIGANHHHRAFATDDLAALAARFD
jgi:hypothetical protein